MFRRSKVILIRGCIEPPISKRLTVAPLQRVNIDHITIAMFLRNPEWMPSDVEPEELFTPLVKCKLKVLVDYIESIEKHFSIISEYASIVVEKGYDVRVVEGMLMDRPWLYSSIKAMHKNIGQLVTEVDLFAPKMNHILIDGQEVSVSAALDMLVPLEI